MSFPAPFYRWRPHPWHGLEIGPQAPRVVTAYICVLSERPIMRSDIILSARVVGGLQMIDGGEADDKLVAVLQNDLVWGERDELEDLPANLVERLTHYFSTYKLVPGADSQARIARRYGFEHAAKVIAAAVEDYAAQYGESCCYAAR